MPAIYVRGVYAFVGAVSRRHHYIKYVVTDIDVHYAGRDFRSARLIGIYPVYRIGTDRDMFGK